MYKLMIRSFEFNELKKFNRLSLIEISFILLFQREKEITSMTLICEVYTKRKSFEL